jgi:hypothetical protein
MCGFYLPPRVHLKPDYYSASLVNQINEIKLFELKSFPRITISVDKQV